MKREITFAMFVGSVVCWIGCETPGPKEPPINTKPEGDPMVSVDTLHPAPEGFLQEHVGTDEFPIPPYAKFLRGVKICLDPGHGGDAHKRAYKRGPTGVREAEMNLRIAKYMRYLLEQAGAEVLLTREADVHVSLANRAKIANDWEADVFISLHHNAIGNKPHVNFTTVWHHADVDYRPSNLDLARYLCYGLYDSIALPQITDVPLKSDQLMYDSGFGILRGARVTAALTESSFFTNPEEEQRLREPYYNLVEAHGLFVGLAKYAAAGLPRAALTEPADGVVAPGGTLVFDLDDGLRSRKAWGWDRQMILSDSIAVRLDGMPLGFEFDASEYTLRVDIPEDVEPGNYDVEVQFQNMNKNSVLNPHFVLTVQG